MPWAPWLLYAAARHCPYDGAAWGAVAVQVANPDIGPDLSGVPEELQAADRFDARLRAGGPADAGTLRADFQDSAVRYRFSVPLAGFVHDF